MSASVRLSADGRVVSCEPPAALLASVRAGDERAVEEVLSIVERFVGWVAHTFVRPTVPIEDLMQEGRIGVLKALQGYDPASGVKFLTYAKPWIEGQMRALARDSSLVRLPAKKAAMMGRIARAAERIGASATDEAVAELVGVSVEEVREADHFARVITFGLPDEEVDQAWDPEGQRSLGVRETETRLEGGYTAARVKELLPLYAELRARLDVTRSSESVQTRGGRRTSSDLPAILLDLDNSLERLPDALFEAVELVDYYGLSGAEAARWAGVHENTIRNRHAQAIKQLTEILCGKRVEPRQRVLDWDREARPVESILVAVRRYGDFMAQLEALDEDGFFEGIEVGWVLMKDEWVPLLSRDLEATAKAMRATLRPLPT